MKKTGAAVVFHLIVAMLLSGCLLRSGGAAPPAALKIVVVVIEENAAGTQTAGPSTGPAIGPSVGLSIGEILLVERLTKAGFQVVPGKWEASTEMDHRRLMSSTDEGARLRARLSDTTGAERLVVLVVTVEENDISGLPVSGHGFVSWNATLRIEALDLKRGIVLAAATATKPGMGLSREAAARKAIEKAMDTLLGGAGAQVPRQEAPFLRDLRAGATR